MRTVAEAFSERWEAFEELEIMNAINHTEEAWSSNAAVDKDVAHAAGGRRNCRAVSRNAPAERIASKSTITFLTSLDNAVSAHRENAERCAVDRSWTGRLEPRDASAEGVATNSTITLLSGIENSVSTEIRASRRELAWIKDMESWNQASLSHRARTESLSEGWEALKHLIVVDSIMNAEESRVGGVTLDDRIVAKNAVQRDRNRWLIARQAHAIGTSQSTITLLASIDAAISTEPNSIGNAIDRNGGRLMVSRQASAVGAASQATIALLTSIDAAISAQKRRHNRDTRERSVESTRQTLISRGTLLPFFEHTWDASEVAVVIHTVTNTGVTSRSACRAGRIRSAKDAVDRNRIGGDITGHTMAIGVAAQPTIALFTSIDAVIPT